MELCSLPEELFDLIIEYLVIQIGIYKAVLLRAVNHAFDAAILHAVCVSQVIDIHHPATRNLVYRISPALRGRIFALRALAANADSKPHIQVVVKVNEELDLLSSLEDQEAVLSRHRAVAGAVRVLRDESIDASYNAQNLLCGAAIAGDLAVVRMILRTDEWHGLYADINRTTPHFDPPLTLAAAHGHYEVVYELLLRGAWLEPVPWARGEFSGDQTDWNNTTSHYARTAALVQTPISALRAAVAGGHNSIVQLCLDQAFRPPLNSVEYLRAIRTAANTGHLELMTAICRTIGKCISDFVGLDEQLLWAAVEGGHIEVAKMLLDQGTDVNAVRHREIPPHHYSTLALAASRGDLDMVRFLLARGASIMATRDRINDSPINKAAERGHEDVVYLLIDHGADPAAALESAAVKGQSHLVCSLLTRLPDLPFRRWGKVGFTALGDAIDCRNLTTITALVKAGVPTESRLWVGGLVISDARKRHIDHWVIDHLKSIGARDDEEDSLVYKLETIVRGVCLSEQTWEWVSKY